MMSQVKGTVVCKQPPRLGHSMTGDLVGAPKGRTWIITSYVRALTTLAEGVMLVRTRNSNYIAIYGKAEHMLFSQLIW